MRYWIAVMSAVLVIGGGGCSPFPQAQRPRADSLRVVADVPYRPQRAEDDCGPAALASLLAHGGSETGVEEIAEAVYTPALDGTLMPDMENYARSLGFSTRSGSGDLPLLRRVIDSGKPVLALLETGLWVVSRPHYVVVYGYDAGGLLAHVGTRKGVYIGNRDFSERWSAMNRLYLYLE